MISGYLMMAVWYGISLFFIASILLMLSRTWLYNVTFGTKQIPKTFIDKIWEKIDESQLLMIVGISVMVFQAFHFLFFSLACFDAIAGDGQPISVEDVLMFPYTCGWVFWIVLACASWCLSIKICRSMYEAYLQLKKIKNR